MAFDHPAKWDWLKAVFIMVGVLAGFVRRIYFKLNGLNPGLFSLERLQALLCMVI